MLIFITHIEYYYATGLISWFMPLG